MDQFPEHSVAHRGVRGADAGRRLQKLTAVLTGRRKVITEGVDSTMEAFTETLVELLARAKAACRQGIQLPTFLAILRDQAER